MRILLVGILTISTFATDSAIVPAGGGPVLMLSACTGGMRKAKGSVVLKVGSVPAKTDEKGNGKALAPPTRVSISLSALFRAADGSIESKKLDPTRVFLEPNATKVSMLELPALACSQAPR